jgi:acyl carrier protein
MALTQDDLLHYFGEQLRLNTSEIIPQTSLFASGLIDSFSLVELVLFIEESCRIKMKPSEVNLDNLDSIDRILAFVERRVPNNGSK